MDKKQIQEQRIRTYFIQATKDILKEDGIGRISVRNIADQAGYSYATLYNYFKDVRDLIFECVKEFQEECEIAVKAKTAYCPRGLDKIKAIVNAYMEFLAQYPGIFELFFLEKSHSTPSQKITIETIYTFLDRLCEDEWDYCVRTNVVTIEEVEGKVAQIRFGVTGLLLFHLKRRQPATHGDLLALANSQLDQILYGVRAR